MYDITELNGKKVDELKSLAKDLSIPGFNKLKKEDLVYQILDVQAEQPQVLKKETSEVKPAAKPVAKKPIKKAPQKAERKEDYTMFCISIVFGMLKKPKRKGL